MSQNKKIYYDKEQDILWIVFKEGEQDSYEELAPGINAEYDADGNLIGIEYFNASKSLIKEIKSLEVNNA